MVKNKLIFEIVFIVSLLLNSMFAISYIIKKYDDSKHYNNTKSYGSMNVENWDKMTKLNKEYSNLLSDLKYLLLYDMVKYGELDTVLLKNCRAHFSITAMKSTPAAKINEFRSDAAYQLDSVYYEYMNSINYIYCHTAEDSLETENSDTYNIFEHFINTDYDKR